jgi:acetylornithine deacetylase
MKGYLAAMLNAADLASTRNLKQPLKLAFSWDEEVGCLGIPQMLPHMAQIGAPAMCVVGEPTGMNIATGHKGKIALTATCHGTAGHSANAPDYLNALHLAADFITALRSVQSDLAQGPSDPAYDTPYSTLHAGILTGGTALNIVPDRADITFELRHLPAEDPAAILARLNSAAQTITAQHPAAKITITQTSAYPGLQTAPDAPVTTCAQSLLPANTRLTKVAYGTEAGHISASGIPTVVCGPGNMAQGHKADEFIEIDQLAQCDAMLAALIERLAAGSV